MRPRARTPETAAILRLSKELTAALRAITDSSPLAGLGPIEIGRTLGVDKTLMSRLMSALRATDPLAALSLLPGVVPLRQFVAAARKHGTGVRAVQAAERKLSAFDHELERSFGTRTRLDAVIADALPEARRRHDDVARQAVYRGMALIKGVSIDLESFTWIVHPSRKNPRRLDILFLAAMIGIHRLRPTARFRVGGSYSRTKPESGPKLLRMFCRPAGLSIAASSEKDFTFYEISTGSVRRDAAADLCLTQFIQDATSRTDSAPAMWNVGDILTYPIKRLELSLLVHEKVWPGCGFSLRAYDTAMRGVVHLPDPERDFDRLPMDAPVVQMPASAEALRASPVPNYEAMVRHLTTPKGWELEDRSGRPVFRRITCEIGYPVYGSQVMLVRE
ncbi:MAG TPA: hypothetical protein VJY35_00755 [Candidatus Eisenbacteria bacterium]|nr:hypothetical protein [Candidatus Eisenbacteria bacterium]